MKNRLQKLYENKKYFEILEIKPTQDLKVISKAFRMIALKYHPEKGGSHDEMVIIVDIMQKLSDENYLQRYFQYIVTGESFNENHFQFETTFRTAKPEHLQNYMDNIIRSMNGARKQVYSDMLNDVLEQVISADLFVDLRESAESPFEVSFHYKHKGSYGEIEIVIREELNDSEDRKQGFQHAITDAVFIDDLEKEAFFLATPENLQKKVDKLIQKINGYAIKRPSKELFDKLNNWLDQQVAEYRERVPAAIEQYYGENTRRGMSKNWLNQIAGQEERIKQDSVGNVRQIAAGVMSFFSNTALLASSSVSSLPQLESHGEHFEMDYYLLGLLTVASLTIVAVFLYCLCQQGKANDIDNSINRNTMPG